jgi:hypothetical protein
MCVKRVYLRSQRQLSQAQARAKFFSSKIPTFREFPFLNRSRRSSLHGPTCRDPKIKRSSFQ